MRQELVIGRVRTAHGVRGELKVESLSGEVDHFLGLESVTLVRGETRETLKVESVRAAHRGLLIKLAGVDSPEVAKKWRGWEIAVPRESASPLGADEYYLADLVGLRVVFDGSLRGTVAAILEGGKTALLEVVLPEGERRIVPFQSEFVSDVDLEGETLTLATDEVLG